MPDEKANTPPEITAKESSVDTSKSASVTTLPPKVDDDPTSNGNGTGPNPSPAVPAGKQTPEKPRLA